MTDLLAGFSIGAFGIVWLVIALALVAAVGAFVLRWYMNLPRYTHEALRPDREDGDE